MEFFHRAAAPPPKRLGILPGSFNPVTIAHLALAQAALSSVQEVVFVLPRIFPHKDFSGGSFEDRIRLLEMAASPHAQFSVAASERGLFLEIAGECRTAYGDDVRLTFLCGRDAAERVAGWDYGRPAAFREMLSHFGLLVAARWGEYTPPAELSHAIQQLQVDGMHDVSATEVRRRIVAGEPWEHLVPAEIRGAVEEIYGG